MTIADDLIEAHRQIEQEKALRALHRMLWDAIHADGKSAYARKYPILPIHEIQKDLWNWLGIRKWARRG